MKRFADFAEPPNILDGDKIRIDDVLNKELIITGCRFTSTKYGEKSKSGKCLTIQVMLDGQKHVVFTGSDVIIDQMTKYENEIPFAAKIKKINRYYTLT